MDALRSAVGELESEEQELLSRRRTEADASLRTTVLTFTVYAVALVITLIALYYGFLRYLAVRERFEQRLHEERRWWETVLWSVGDAVMVTDHGGRVRFMNPVAEELCGWSQAEATNRGLADVFRIVNEKTRQFAENPVEKVLREGTVVGLANHTVLIAKEGTERPIDDSAAPIHGDDGSIKGVVLVFRDVTQRRRAEQRLADDEARIRSVVNHVLDGIITIDENGLIEAFNPAAEKLFGYKADEVVGQNIKVLMPEPYHSEHDGYIANYRSTGHAKVIGIGREVEGRKKDGSSFPMDLAVSEFWLGKRHHFTGIVRDITERKRAEESLREQAALLDLAHDAIIVCSTEGVITFWNPGAEAMYGWAAGEAIGKVTHTLLQTEFPEPLPDIKTHLNEHGRWEGMLNHTTKDGRRIAVASRWALRRANRGKTSIVLEINRDVTHQKRAEEAVRESERRLAEELADMTCLREVSTRLVQAGDTTALLLDIVDAAVAVTDADMGNIQLRDRDSGRLRIMASRGFDAPFLDFFNAVHDGQAACGTAMLNEKRVVIEDVSTSPIFAGTRELDVLLTAGVRAVQSTPLVSRSGILVGILSTHYRVPRCPTEKDFRLLDLVARQAADFLERHHAEQALQDADRRKDEFLATLGHELRNPLAAIRNAVMLLRLKDGPTDPQLELSRDIIDRQATQLTRLMDDLLDVSRIGQGKVELKKEPLDVRDVARRAAEGIQPLVEAKKHQFRLSFPETPLPANADAARLEQIVGNLLSNAAKYTDEGGSITLRADREGDDIVIRVRDTGVGISADQLPHIFGLFTQVGSSLDRSQGGLGIGLALVKSLAEMHGGSVMATSEGLGRGSEFTLRLPALVGRLKALVEVCQSEGGARTLPCKLAPCRILIVDDDVDTARSMVRLLNVEGHTVRTAHDGPKALELARELRPEVVLLDIGLPGMDGYQLARAFRGDDTLKDATLIAVSGYGQEHDRTRSREAGFDHHLIKPVDFDRLRALLSEPIRETEQMTVESPEAL
jgi:PAS domain S-box-containing protein